MSNHIPTPKRLKKRKRRFVFLLITFLFFFVGIYFGDKWAKKNGFTSFWDLVTTVSSNYLYSWNADYEIAEITISEGDYLNLEKQREKHLEKGIITKLDDRYVPALISFKNKKIKCKLRLKGHMTDHLQNKKWSFRIKTIGGDSFKGMRIFSLMHPGTRNYIYEWIFHQMLQQEGIATVRYSFIKLKVNGSNWGIYAVEENFGNELLDNSKLPKGPIVGFNPDLYWYARQNDHEKINVDVENIYIGASYPEAFDEEENFKNEEAKSDYAEATILLEKFRRGQLKTSDVFDVPKLAKFHSIIDLVGGHFSLDWSDVKYYYNPMTQKIEPVGYESFSVQNIKTLSGSSKFKNSPGKNSEWHELLFSDPIYFERYVKELKRIAKKKYLDDFFASHINEINNNLAILYREFPYKKLSFDQYFINQKNINTLLKAPIMPAIYFNGVKNDSLEFTIGCNALLPLRLNEIVIGDKKIQLENSIFISTRGRGESIYFEKLKIALKDTFSKKELNTMKWSLSYLGMDEVHLIQVKPIQVTSELNSNFTHDKPNMEKFDFIKIDEERKEIIVESGNHSINSDLIIASGYKVIAKAPLQFNLSNGSRIISYSPFELLGTEENRVVINSNDDTGKGIILINCLGKSKFKNVDFLNLGLEIDKSDSYQGILNIYNSSVSISSCSFISDADIGILCLNSNLVISGSTFLSGFKKNGLVAEYSTIDLNRLEFSKIKKNGIKTKSTSGKMRNLVFSKVKNPIQLENYSIIKGENWTINNAETGISANDLSTLDLVGLKMNDVEVGFHAEMKDDVFGPSTINVKGLKKEKVNKLKETDSKSKVIIK